MDAVAGSDEPLTKFTAVCIQTLGGKKTRQGVCRTQDMYNMRFGELRLVPNSADTCIYGDERKISEIAFVKKRCAY